MTKCLSPINGILLVDKPTGISSNALLQRVKRLFNAKKAGHTGSLDPLATGMLPICFGEATKYSQFLLDANKSYYVQAKLGISTTTGDSEGEVIAENSVHVNESQLREVLRQFQGLIQQIPPMYSALKHQGRPLYDYARKGIAIAREARSIIIHELILKHFAEDSVSFVVRCSKGTYVRSLVEDIGTTLGCGGHVIKLHRLQVDPYQEQQLISYDHLQQLHEAGQYSDLLSLLLPVDSALQKIPLLNISKEQANCLSHGQTVEMLLPSLPGLVRLRCDDHFWGIGEIMPEGKVVPKRLIASYRAPALKFE